MITEEEKKRYIEATRCNGCTDWHHHCQSECCKLFFIDINPEEIDRPGSFLKIKPSRNLSLSDIMYFQLRDVKFSRGFLIIKKDRLQVIGKRVIYFYPCKLLDGNLCRGHPNNKPDVCKALTLETSKLTGQKFGLTDNCLFKYKCKEVKKDD